MRKKDLRDDFPESVKTQLAKRVGYRCSRPDCQKPTSGPSLSTTEAINMGVAAHITAASARGARYDPSLTSDQRKSYENGIWLCKYCADLVDKDPATYPVELLRAWKSEAERKAGLEVHRLPQVVEDEISATIESLPAPKTEIEQPPAIEIHGLPQLALREPTSPEQKQDRLELWLKSCKTRWDQLVARDLANEQPSRYKFGYWMTAYRLIGNLNQVEPSDLRVLLRQSEDYSIGSNGYAVWAMTDGSLGELDTNSYENCLECWMGRNLNLNAVDSHFWRASPEGSLFLLRGYQEDSESDKVHPGTILWIKMPIRDVGEVLLHSHRLAEAFGDKSASVAIRFLWEGLTNRNLSSCSQNRPRLEKMLLQSNYVCQQPSVPSEFTVSVRDISVNLPKIVEMITKPLYQSFNFYKPPTEFIREEISKVRGNGLYTLK